MTSPAHPLPWKVIRIVAKGRKWGHLNVVDAKDNYVNGAIPECHAAKVHRTVAAVNAGDMSDSMAEAIFESRKFGRMELKR